MNNNITVGGVCQVHAPMPISILEDFENATKMRK